MAINLKDYELVKGEYLFSCYGCAFDNSDGCPYNCDTDLRMLKAGEFSADEIEQFRDAVK